VLRIYAHLCDRLQPLVLAGALALGVAFAAPAEAQSAPPSTVEVSVDGAGPGTPLRPVWPFFGFDEINYTTSPEGKALLATLASANSAPVHVRSHFLFNTGDGSPGLKWGSTNVYTEDAAGNPVYSWSLTDGIMDAITAAGAFPFVELGFMPEALSTNPSPYRNSSSSMLDGGFVYPPKDYAKWADLVRTWVRHADERYPNVASSWHWELWNEPDIPYWSGTFEEYEKLYDHTESALHEVLPTAALGGPAVAGPAGTFFRRFLEHCASGTNAVTGNTGTRLDLVSFHAKGGVALEGDHVQMNLGSQLRLHRAGFKIVAGFPLFQQTPIYITEADPDGCAACPVSSVPADAYRNSPAYGAYELTMMKHSLELETELGVKLGGILTWAFTFPGTPYFAGYRALTTNGIDLPVLGAFKLLGKLSGTRLALTSTGAHGLDELLTSSVRDQPEIDGMATADGDTVRVLLWNYHDDLLTVPATPVHLSLKVPLSMGASVRVSHLRVDDLHGDAYTVWVKQGRPTNPSTAQVRALEQAMAPESLVPDETVPVSTSGTITLDFALPRFGVSLLTFRPSGGEAESGMGGRSSAGGDNGGPRSNAGQPQGGCACHFGSADPSKVPATLLWLNVVGVFALARRRRIASLCCESSALRSKS
jgi:xylan 1,4-beta-xylosidase